MSKFLVVLFVGLFGVGLAQTAPGLIDASQVAAQAQTTLTGLLASAMPWFVLAIGVSIAVRWLFRLFGARR